MVVVSGINYWLPGILLAHQVMPLPTNIGERWPIQALGLNEDGWAVI